MKKKKSAHAKNSQRAKHSTTATKARATKKSGVLKEKKNHTDSDFHHEHSFVE